MGLTAFCVCLPFMSIWPLACSLKCSCSSSLVAIFISHITHLWPSSCKGSLLSDPCAPVPVTVPLIFTPLLEREPSTSWQSNLPPYSSLANIETVASVAAASKAAPSDGDTWHLAHTTGAIWRGNDLICVFANAIQKIGSSLQQIIKWPYAAPSDEDTWHLAHTTGAIWRGNDLMCVYWLVLLQFENNSRLVPRIENLT